MYFFATVRLYLFIYVYEAVLLSARLILMFC